MLLSCRWSRLGKVKDAFLLDWIEGSHCDGSEKYCPLGCDAM
jgi:hypothetical protein